METKNYFYSKYLEVNDNSDFTGYKYYTKLNKNKVNITMVKN